MTEELVEAGNGIRLMIHSNGQCVPPVVCLSCAGGAHDEWSAASERLSSLARVLSYGRPGLGGSDPLPEDLAGTVQSIEWAARQLRTLLANAGIPSPYVLLTSSIGSWIADQYAAIWPTEVAGPVLVDPTMVSAWPELAQERSIVDGDEDDSGCIRLTWEDGFAELARSLPPHAPRRVVISGSDDRWERDTTPSAWHQPLALAEVDVRWQAAQREWASRLSAVHVIADTAGHFVHRDQPDLIAHVTAAVVRAARVDEDVRLEADEVVAVGGRISGDERRQLLS